MKEIFCHACDTLDGWRKSGAGSEERVTIQEGCIVLCDDSSFADTNVSTNVTSLPAEWTLEVRLRFAQLIDLLLDPSGWSCEEVWCLQCIYAGNVCGNSFSVGFSQRGVWTFYNPTDTPAGPGGGWVLLPDTARYLDHEWYTWTFWVTGRDDVSNDYVDIFRDGGLIARRVRIHNHECPDGLLHFTNRGIEQNPAEMHLGGVRAWAGHVVGQEGGN